MFGRIVRENELKVFFIKNKEQIPCIVHKYEISYRYEKSYLRGIDMLEFKDGRCICGTVKVGERGQIVIPKKARDYFNVEPGDNLIMVGDMNSKTMTILKADSLDEFVEKMNMSSLASTNKGEK